MSSRIEKGTTDTELPKDLRRRYVMRWGVAAAVGAGATALVSPRANAAAQAEAPTNTGGHVGLESLVDASITYISIDRDPDDTFQPVRRRLDFKDVAASKGSVVNIDHRGDGTGNATNPGQTYGVDIHNFPGSRSALVIHQYSSLDRALMIDNTGSSPSIEINNTRNDVINPGSDGTGDFLVFRDHGTLALRVDKNLVFRMGAAKTATFVHTSAKALSVQTSSTFDGEAMDVTKAGKGPGTALRVSNSGTGIGLHITETGGGRAVQIDANYSANAGQYAALVQGYDYGLSATTSGDNGTTLVITKSGTGGGTVQQIVNKGSGNSFEARDTTGQRFTIAASGLISVIQGQNVNLGAGIGSPEGARSAPVGSIYLRSDGESSSTLYVKESGGTTKLGWVAK
ncbi:hypothetical protein [Arthrobacter sp. ISL-72]|uniref:hypothetical protein n=1 Tax=Arthrobacter sp. ISL-72 TaxID=2819114 RepID=UPI001BEAD1B9|nr:hypothetical protein [Arthrobacter sp. ISL-72]MBT2594681.1 hypothetical protein [Arthrobacter sp. ISL-72]